MRQVDAVRARTERMQLRLRYLSPESKLRENRSYAAELEERLRGCMERLLRERRHSLALLSGQLEGLSPVKKLSGGYSYVTDAAGAAVRDAGKIACGDELDIQLWKGSLKTVVTEVKDE